MYGQHWEIYKTTDTLSPPSGDNQSSECFRRQEQSGAVPSSKVGDQKREDVHDAGVAHKSISSAK